MSTEQAPSPQEPPKTSRGWLKILVIVVLPLAAGGAGAAWWLLGARGAAQPGAGVREDTGVLAFEPFTVNLADADAPAYLRISLGLVVAGTEGDVKELQADRVRVLRARSAIIELLTVQTSARLSTADGKQALKHAIATSAGAALEPTEVKDVLFTDFVVQY